MRGGLLVRTMAALILFVSFLWSMDGKKVAEGVEIKCEEMSPKKFIEMVEKKDKKLVIVDYRIPEDYYIKGHIPSAILLSPKDKNFLRQRLDYFALQWKKNGKTAVIVDNDGREANVFCRNMKLTTRYEHIYSLKGGMNLMTLPLEKGKMPVPGKKGKK
jgi:rhodanese-related sulfurtransferase